MSGYKTVPGVILVEPVTGRAVGVKTQDVEVFIPTFSADQNSLLKSDGSQLAGVGGGSYTLPLASASTLGGVKIGSGLSIDGSGIVTASGGGVSGTGVDPNDVALLLVGTLGQSNMSGRGTLDTLIDVLDPRVFQFSGAEVIGNGNPTTNTYYRKIIAGVDPIHNFSYAADPTYFEGINTGHNSLQTWFARAFAATLPTNLKVLLVPCSYGGSGLVTGSPNWQAGGLYANNVISQMNLALAAAQAIYPNSRVAGFIDLHGEADQVAGIAQAIYVAPKKALIAALRAGVTGAANSWYVMGGMAPGFIASGYGNSIHLAHQQVAAETNKCMFVAGPTASPQSLMDDGLHYTAQGLRILGSRMGLAVQAAMAYVYVSGPATGFGLAGPAGLTGAVNADSGDFTVTIAPNGGSLVGTVRVTPNDGGAGGTFTPAYLDFVTGFSGAFKYKPNGSASTRTISITNNGSGLTNPASLSYVATAAATAPATMSAPVATAGDVSASLAFTVPANGGATITGYTITPYIAGAAQTPQNPAGLTSPLVATGLANGTAYTFKMHANNPVGPGTDSLASNSVTPAPVAAALSLRNMGFMQATAGVSQGYEGTTGTFWSGEGWSTLNLAFQSGVDGSIVIKMLDAPSRGGSPAFVEIGLGVDAADTTNSAARTFDGIDYFLMHRSDGMKAYTNNTDVGTDSGKGGIVALQNDLIRVTRTGSTLVFAVSSDGGTTWTDIKTFTGVSTGVLYIHVNACYTTHLKLISSSGLA